MTTYMPTFPDACFKDMPGIDDIILGRSKPVSELAMPVVAVKMAGMTTADNLDRLIDYFQELSKQYPSAIVIFLCAVAMNPAKVSFAAHNLKFTHATAALGKYF